MVLVTRSVIQDYETLNESSIIVLK